MKKAGDFLSRFDKLTPPNDALRRAVAEAVRLVCEVPLAKTHVSISNKVAFIEASNIVKNKIRMHRKDILDAIYDKIPKAKESIRDIR